MHMHGAGLGSICVLHCAVVSVQCPDVGIKSQFDEIELLCLSVSVELVP